MIWSSLGATAATASAAFYFMYKDKSEWDLFSWIDHLSETELKQISRDIATASVIAVSIL